MRLTIARKIGKDKYRFITVNKGNKHVNNVHLLLTFYRQRERVDLLLALGDLEYLGPSPLNNSNGEDDEVNCRANFRDCGKSEESNQASETVSLDRLYTNADVAYIFDNEQWYLLNYNHTFQPLSRIVPPIRYPDKLKGLNVEEIKFGYFYSVDNVKTRDQLQSESDRQNKTFYVFRDSRLIHIINPQKQLENGL